MSTQDLTTCDIKYTVRRMAIPASIGYLFNILFNIEDTFYAGYLGTDAQGALAYSFVLFFMIIAVSIGLSNAASGLLARSLGQNKTRRARYYAAQFFISILASGIFLMIFGRLFLAPILTFLGATGAQHALTLEYLTVIFDFAPLFVATMVLSGMLNAQGNTTTFRNALIVATVLNLLFDPMLMFGWFGLPAFGMFGIGLATVLAQLLMATWLFVVYLRTTPYLRGMKLIYLRPRLAALNTIVRQAIPQSLSMLSICAGFFINTFFLARQGETVIASYGIALRIEQVVLVMSLGINVATLAIAAQNFGAKKFDRVHEAVRTALQYGFMLALCGGAVMLIGGQFLFSLFNDDPEMIGIGYSYLITGALLAPFYVIIHTYFSTLQAIGTPALIGPLSMFRLAVLPITFNCILVLWLELGVVGVWITLGIANISVASFLFGFTRPRINAKLRALALA